MVKEENIPAFLNWLSSFAKRSFVFFFGLFPFFLSISGENVLEKTNNANGRKQRSLKFGIFVRFMNG